MGGERAHGRREGTWEERGHMGGERAHGRREGTWEERERTHGRGQWLTNQVAHPAQRAAHWYPW